MGIRSWSAVLALVLLLLSGQAMAARGDWWSPGDDLPTGDGGPEVLPAGTSICGSATTYDLFAGQTQDVGSITIANDADQLYVTYHASGTNTFGTLHLWVGIDLADVPSNPQGTPVPGQFPYHYEAGGGQEYTFTLPLGTDGLNVACDTTLYVVAHAEVTTDGGTSGEHETAFGGDTPGGGPRWWYSMTHDVQCCDTPPPGGEGTFETAFAKGGWVFASGRKANPERLDSLRLTRNRWGWAINLPATDEAVETTYEIWAGAGLNDTDKGTHVGTLTLTWDGTDLEVAYDMFVGYTMSEVHVYAGDEAPDTIAPGQYGTTEAFDPYAASTVITLEDIQGDDADDDGIWVIAHAVVFGEM